MWRQLCSQDYSSFYKEYATISALATGIGGLIPKTQESFTSIDDIYTPCMLAIGNPPASWDAPIPYGILVVFRGTTSYTCQVVFLHINSGTTVIKYRFHNGDSWSAWSTIATT